VTVLGSVLVNAEVVARICLDRGELPGEAISPELPSTRRSLRSWQIRHHADATAHERSVRRMKGAVVEMIKTRLALAQPAH
jgi:hypothetical protein